jgi:hypothetical protein
MNNYNFCDFNKFNDYVKIFDEYNSEYKKTNHSHNLLNITHKKLRRLDIRFRLTLGYEVKFNNQISKTKHELTNRTYILIYKINDLWFVYEVFYKTANDFNILNFDGDKSKIIESLGNHILESTNITRIIEEFNNKLYNYYNNTSRKQDFDNFIRSLNPNEKNNKYNYLTKKFKAKQNMEIKDIINLVYGNRNNFVHTDSLGITALTGVKNYRTKIKIYEFSYEVLVNILYECLTYLLRLQTERIKSRQ